MSLDGLRQQRFAATRGQECPVTPRIRSNCRVHESDRPHTNDVPTELLRIILLPPWNPGGSFPTKRLNIPLLRAAFGRCVVRISPHPRLPSPRLRRAMGTDGVTISALYLPLQTRHSGMWHNDTSVNHAPPEPRREGPGDSIGFQAMPPPSLNCGVVARR